MNYPLISGLCHLTSIVTILVLSGRLSTALKDLYQARRDRDQNSKWLEEERTVRRAAQDSADSWQERYMHYLANQPKGKS